MPAPEGVVAHVDDLRVPDDRLANVPSALLCSTVSRLDWVGSTSRLRRPIPFVLGFPMVPFATVLDFFAPPKGEINTNTTEVTSKWALRPRYHPASQSQRC